MTEVMVEAVENFFDRKKKRKKRKGEKGRKGKKGKKEKVGSFRF